jgi:hypothetical protein
MKLRRLLMAALAMALAASGQSALAASDCFERDDSKSLSYDVFQIAPPPAYSFRSGDYPDTSPAYPASDYTTTTIRLIKDATPPSASGFSFRKYYFLWANRCLYLKGITPDSESCRNTTRFKGNAYFEATKDGKGSPIRAAFSTYAKANACTRIRALHALGETAELALLAREANISLWEDPDRGKLSEFARAVTVGDGTMMRYLVDLCVLEADAQAADAAGIVLDYEVWDDRTPAEVVVFTRELHDIAKRHGKKLVLTTNPLPRRPNGIDASNVRELIDAVDGFAATISSGATPGNPAVNVPKRSRTFSPLESYRNQLALMTDNGKMPLSAAMRSKIIWNISLFDTELSEAKALHDEFKTQAYRGVMIFRNYVKQGGSCERPENQVIACIALGVCDGKFGVGR